MFSTLFLCVATTKAGQSSATTIFSPLTISEEEFGSLEDYTVLGIIFLSAIFCFLAAPLIFTTVSATTGALTSFFVITTTALFLPVSVLQKFGVEAPQYVRGAGKSTVFIYEFILDFVAVLTIFVRFAVQNIRIVFLLLAYWELYVFIEQNLEILAFSPNVTTVISIINISNIFASGLLYLYYVGHLCILYTMQIAAYLGLSFWLFFFLYTNFSSGSNESWFKQTRYVPSRLIKNLVSRQQTKSC